MTRHVLDKMGLRAGMATAIWRLPDELRPVFAPAIEQCAEPAHWRVGFAADARAIEEAAGEFAPSYRVGQIFWLCYPKKSGPVRTDIARDHGWGPITALDMHGVAQISVDGTWSALRFRLRDEIVNFTRRPSGQ